MALVKICGLTDPGMVRVAAEAGADWVGFVLFEKSPRNVLTSGAGALDAAEELCRFADDLGVASVVLLVNPDDALFEGVLHDVAPTAIQLHGQETADKVMRHWRDAQGVCELWKAVSIASEDDLTDLDQWPADRLLLDAKPPEDSALPGGNGEVMDWSLLDGLTLDKPWLLAGGLTAHNVAAAIAATDAPAVDVSSGVERAPGVKDEDKIRAFIDAAKSA
ncbi:MAG: phosphoribosylanthranilate isomerase [Pseudomonadota bacterium]